MIFGCSGSGAFEGLRYLRAELYTAISMMERSWRPKDIPIAAMKSPMLKPKVWVIVANYSLSRLPYEHPGLQQA